MRPVMGGEPCVLSSYEFTSQERLPPAILSAQSEAPVRSVVSKRSRQSKLEGLFLPWLWLMHVTLWSSMKGFS